MFIPGPYEVWAEMSYGTCPALGAGKQFLASTKPGRTCNDLCTKIRSPSAARAHVLCHVHANNLAHRHNTIQHRGSEKCSGRGNIVGMKGKILN